MQQLRGALCDAEAKNTRTGVPEGTVADLNALRAYPATVPFTQHPDAVCFPMCSYFFSRHVSRGRYRPFTRASYRKLPEVQLSHIYQGQLSPIDQGKLSQISEVKLSQTPGGYYPVSPMSSRPVSVIRSARRFPRSLRAVMTVCSPLSSHTPGGDFPEYLPISSQPVAVIRRACRCPWKARSIIRMTTISVYQPNLACKIGCKSCFGGSWRAEGVVREAPGGLPGAI